jgi:hypothetical protein
MQSHDNKKEKDSKHDIADVSNALQDRYVNDLVRSLKNLNISQDEYQRIRQNYKAILGALSEVEKIYMLNFSEKINSFFTTKKKRVFTDIKNENNLIRENKNFFNRDKLVIDKVMALAIFKLYAKKYDDKTNITKKLNKLNDHYNARMGAIIMMHLIRSGVIKKSDLTGKDASELSLLHNAFDLLSDYDDKEWKKDDKYKKLYEMLSSLKGAKLDEKKADIKDSTGLSAAAISSAAMPVSAAGITVNPERAQFKHAPVVDVKDSVKFALPSKWNYQLTVADLKHSSNKFIRDVGVVYSKDRGGDPLTSLRADFERDVKFNHKSLKEFKVDDKKNQDINALIKQQFSERHYELLKKHYSQASSLLLSAPIGAAFDLRLSVIVKQPVALDRHIDLYTEGNDVYVKSIAKRFPLSSQSGDLVGYLSGPVEVTCKLTENGFELQSIKTSSRLINDIYLLQNVFHLRLKLEAIDYLLSEMDNKFQTNNQYIDVREAILSVRNVLEKYWNGEINFIDVINKMEVLEASIGLVNTVEFSTAMQQLLDQIDSINQQENNQSSGYEPDMFYGTTYFSATQFPLDKLNQNLVDVKKALLSAANFQVDKAMSYCDRHEVFSTPEGREAVLAYQYTRMQDLYILAQDVFLIRQECETIKSWSGMTRVSLADQYKDDLDQIEKSMIDGLYNYSSHYLVGPVYKQIYELLKAVDIKSSPHFQKVLADCQARLSNGEFDFEAKLISVDMESIAERLAHAATPASKNDLKDGFAP